MHRNQVCKLCIRKSLEKTAQNEKQRFVQTYELEFLFKMKDTKINRKSQEEISVQTGKLQNEQKLHASCFCSKQAFLKKT